MKYIASTFLFFCATVAWGCSFGPDADIMKSPEENFEKYTYVFSGTFTERRELNEQYAGNSGEYDFQIYQVHKGQVTQPVVTMQSPGHSCGFFGATGGHVLLFMNNLYEIDEAVPKYYFDSEEEVVARGNSLGGPVNTTTSQAPADCKVWYDGCNTCNRSVVGGPLACTRMACLITKDSVCREYFGESGYSVFDEPTWGVVTNQVITSPYTLTGSHPGTDGWITFEGQVGHVVLYDANGTVLDEAPMQVSGSWMQPGPYDYTVTFDFDAPATKTGYVVFHNENPSGMPAQDRTHRVNVVFDKGTVPQVVGPTTPPGVGFVGPTTPPPAKPTEVEEVVPKQSWWVNTWQWIKDLFTW